MPHTKADSIKKEEMNVQNRFQQSHGLGIL